MAIPFGMFDHSEHINNDTVTKILASTDPAASIIKRDWFYMVEPFDMPVSPEDITPDHEISGKCIITYFEDDTCVYLRV